MLIQRDIMSSVFFDIETVSQYKDFESLKNADPTLAKHWEKRADWYRRWYKKGSEDLSTMTTEEIYTRKAALQAEYGKIVCISVGQVKYGDDNLPFINTKSFVGSEPELLAEFLELVRNIESLQKFNFVGHNIDAFDIPFIAKRMITNEITPPSTFIVHNQKPWERSFVDTCKVWGSGAFAESYTSLSLLCHTLGVPTPKDAMDGSEVHEYYYDRDDLESIVKYCEKDVQATANCCLKMANLAIIGEHENETTV